MKAYKLTVLVVDHDEVGDGIADMIENANYPNDAIAPRVLGVQSVDIGEWRDSHPLNFLDKQVAFVSSAKWEPVAPVAPVIVEVDCHQCGGAGWIAGGIAGDVRCDLCQGAGHFPAYKA